jgi:hypothetical protein
MDGCSKEKLSALNMEFLHPYRLVSLRKSLINLKTFFFSLALLYCCLVHSQTVKDTIFFTNGSMVVGKLEKIKLGLVTFDPDDANDITVQLRKLKTISAASKVFRVETVDEQVHFGIIKIHPQTNHIYFVSAEDTLDFWLEDITVLYAYEKYFAQRFSGSFGLGFSYTRSSDFGRLNFDTKIFYTSDDGEISLFTSGIYTIYDTLFSRDKEDITIKYNHFFIRQWFATAFVVYQRNLELGLQRRFQEGLGVGNKFITNKNMYAWARTGFVINQEKSTDGVSSGNLSEIFGQLELNFFRFEKPEINIFLEEAFYYSLSQSDRFRNDGRIKISWEVFKDFDFSLEPYNNFDSKPPVPGSPKMDYGVVFGINYTFN